MRSFYRNFNGQAVRTRVLTLMAMLLVMQASADSVRRLEVFVDTDPGPGNGTAIGIPLSAQADSVTSSFSYTLPANLAPGKHILYVRALADTAGNFPRWSLVQRREFYVPGMVVAAEYFFDNDPGTGAGTAIAVSMPSDSVNLNASIAATGLGAGKHALYVRTKSNAGRWGVSQRRDFYVNTAITAAEYFIDNDPGAGAGTALSVALAADTISAGYSIATPAGLSAGRHRLYLRTSSGGKWSLSQVREFEVLPLIDAAEYFFDTDPGIGSGTALAVGTAGDTVQFGSTVSTTGLAAGPHRLYIRTHAANGCWGLSAGCDFYVVPRIVAAEYFWDTDPGPGNGVAIAVSTPGDTVGLSTSIKAPCLTPGSHHLYLRTKDETGRWALSHEDTVIFSNPAVVANLSYPGPGPYGTPVKITGTGGTGPYTFTYNGGVATTDSIFLPPNAGSVVFTATDSCGYNATANLTTPASPTVIAGGNTGSGSVVLSSYRHWAWVLNGGGQIIAAVKDNGKNLGTVSVDYLKNNSGSVRIFPASTIRYLDRNWLIHSTELPTTPVGLQLYAVDSEYNALLAADPGLGSRSALRVQKYDGPNEDLSPSNNNGPGATLVELAPDSVVAFNGVTAGGNGYALAFSVSAFSEFYQSRSAAVPLANAPLLLQLRRSLAGVELNWKVDVAGGVLAQVLERGSSEHDLENLASVPVNTGSGYTDRQPLSGMNYYRVRAQTDDGRALYSNTVSIRVIGERMISVYPNPARDFVQVDGLGSGDAIGLYDVAGRRIFANQTAGRLGLRGLAAGIYLLQIRLASREAYQQRIEVLR